MARWERPLGGGKTGRNPTDRGKLGVKRSVMVDAAGIPIGLATDGANRNDCKLTEPTLQSIAIERPEPTVAATQGVCLDKAYDHAFVRKLLGDMGFMAHIRSRGEEARRAAQGRRRTCTTVGRRAHSLMDQPLPRPTDPLV
jgi:putative transposase